MFLALILYILGPIGECDPVEGPRVEFTADDRAEVRARVRAGCESLGASPTLCAFYDVIVWRESRGRASIRHTRAEGEHGLGPMGLSLRDHRDKWPGRDEDPAFCIPEVSLLVAHAIVWRAFDRYHAESAVDFQAIYSGRWACDKTASRRTCYADPSAHTRSIVCGWMRDRGADCDQILSTGDLGARVALGERPQLARDMAARWFAGKWAPVAVEALSVARAAFGVKK